MLFSNNLSQHNREFLSPSTEVINNTISFENLQSLLSWKGNVLERVKVWSTSALYKPLWISCLRCPFHKKPVSTTSSTEAGLVHLLDQFQPFWTIYLCFCLHLKEKGKIWRWRFKSYLTDINRPVLLLIFLKGKQVENLFQRIQDWQLHLVNRQETSSPSIS